MSPRSNWAAVKPILEQALEAKAVDRPSLLDRLCPDPRLRAEVEELLALDDHAEGFLEKPAFSLRPPNPESADGEGLLLGPWRLLHPLGLGGMGEVYLAERADGAFEQTVAVKLLQARHARSALIARFEDERRLLARLNHPHIARLLDGGTTPDGRPYLVMEQVEGERIDAYCDRSALSVRARLELFRTVCGAVQVAHQNLVVHGDLKPENILVDREGTIKLLDFGIARLIGTDTEPHGEEGWPEKPPFTPGSASPEQLRGEPISTASDVYSLGVLLYRLLSGEPPYRVAGLRSEEVLQVVNTAEVQPPSHVARAAGRGGAERLARQLAGDLDAIVERALEKEPADRFASAEQLSEDLRLYLAGLPVRSRPDSFSYRAGKFLSRHRIAVSAGAAIFVLLLGFAGLMAWQRQTIASKSREVTRERDRAEATKEFLLDLIAQADPRVAKGQEITVRQALDRRARRLNDEVAIAPVDRADLLDALGIAYRSLGRSEEAAPLTEKALALRRSALGDRDARVAESLQNLANLARDFKQPEKAEALIREALVIQRASYPKGHRDLARGLNNLASLLREKGDAAKKAGGPILREAESLAREGLEMKTRLFGTENAEVAVSLNTLAAILATAGRPAEGENLYRRSIALRKKVDGDISPGLAKTINNLAVLLTDLDRLREAEALHRESLALRRRLYPEGHPDLLTSLNNLARLCTRMGDTVEAAKLHREAMKLNFDLGDEKKVKMSERELKAGSFPATSNPHILEIPPRNRGL